MRKLSGGANAEAFLAALDDIFTLSGLEWNDKAKLLVMGRFLEYMSGETPYVFYQFEKFIQEQANKESVTN